MVNYKTISSKTLKGTRVKIKKGGLLISSYSSCTDNPCLVGISMTLIANPRLTIKNGYGLFESENERNRKYDLERDSRQPRICPSCTPVPEHPENGISLGWKWLITTQHNNRELLNYNTGHMDDYLILFTSNDTNPTDALRHTLETHVRKINSAQSEKEKQNKYFSRAPKITPNQIQKALDFMVKDLSRGMPLEQVWPQIKREQELAEELAKKSLEAGKGERFA